MLLKQELPTTLSYIYSAHRPHPYYTLSSSPLFAYTTPVGQQKQHTKRITTFISKLLPSLPPWDIPSKHTDSFIYFITQG